VKKFLALFLLVSSVLTISSAANAQFVGRTFGLRRLIIDAGDGLSSNFIYLIDRLGALGIDNTGLTNPAFPNSCALLDLSSTTKGLLPPRMTNVQMLAICSGTPPEGLIVANLTKHALDYYNGTGFSEPWMTKGNYLTDPAVDYIGTNDPNDFVIRTNLLERIRFDANGNTTITGGNTTINESAKQFVINATGSGYAAKINTSQEMGLKIQCNTQSGTDLNSDTHFIDFFDGGGANRGSIQGQNNYELTHDPIYIANEAIFIANTVLSGLLNGGSVAGAVGAFLCAADPCAATAAGIAGAIGAGQFVQLGVAIAQYNIIDGLVKGSLGVSYQSSAGDYAEYLKRVNPDDKLYPGDIVGVKNGMISKNTEGAQNVFSVSLAPIVLGNVPEKGHEAEYNKVGFLEQVPVKVRGVVHEGDFIIASGLNDGIGIAVSAENITAAQFPLLIGRAWSSSSLEMVKYVKVAVGLNAKAMSEIISHEQNEIDVLKNEVRELRKSNAEVTSMKTKLDRIEKYLMQSGNEKVMLKSN
jgi:hypothetical protein